jgi:LytS/YehU family sensor histidine kinase
MRIPFSEITGAELVVGTIRLAVGGAVAFLVYRGVTRLEWPRPMRFRFVLFHVMAAPLAAALWLGVSSLLEFTIAPSGTDLVGQTRVQEFMVIGIFVYIPIVMASYAAQGAARVAQAEAAAARTQLAALRAQLHPHFLFNALHSVVQLIPADPHRAAEAAELIGDLLRTALEEQRDEVPLADEWRFVSRYLDVERIRFGDRLIIRPSLPDELLDERVPSFAVQTLVENAVLHGAAPRVGATEIEIVVAATPSSLTLTVRNSGDPAAPSAGMERAGTGLARLRQRLKVLYGNAATMKHGPRASGGYEATMTVPRGLSNGDA